MQTIRKLSLTPLILLLLSACGNDETSKMAGVSHVDSAALSAPDTLRASTDTSSRRQDTGHAGAYASPKARIISSVSFL